MTISSDAFARYFASVPCFKHQLKTWHEHEREVFYSATAGFPGQARDLGLTLLPSEDSYSGLMFPAVTMRRHLSIARASSHFCTSDARRGSATIMDRA